MNIAPPKPKFQPIDDLPDGLDPEFYPIICRHWYGIEVDVEPAKKLTADSSRMSDGGQRDGCDDDDRTQLSRLPDPSAAKNDEDGRVATIG